MSATGDAAEARTTLELKGLEADNLLAFLALLGLLRALDVARPEWQARVAWRGVPPVAVLELAEPTTREEVTAAADEGIRKVGIAYRFDKPDLKYAVAEFRDLFRSWGKDRVGLRLLAALASDGVTKRDGDEVEATPLCAMFGQGHQHFLSRLTAMAQRDHPANLQDLERALFEPWRYDDETESFRWDPIEDRRYALQFGDPSEGRNKIGTVTGANRLAAIGFAAFVTAPRADGLATVGTAGRRGRIDICWPVVAVPTTLAGHAALLAHPSLGDAERAPELAPYGVRAVARARRFQSGKYFNFERARLQPL